MKTTFKRYLQESMPKAELKSDLLDSIKDGKFSLDGSDLKVEKDFWCDHKKLTSLKGGPKEVAQNFSCSNNYLTSLEGVPSKIGATFFCGHNKLTSLEDIHKHIQEIGKAAYFTNNPIKSHVLGLLKIKKLNAVFLSMLKVEDIINKYLPEGDIFACQQELIDAGFEEYAQL